MKKRKTYEVSVINKTYSKTYSDQTKFYTSDTALELGFELLEVEYSFDSAEILLLNVDDRSFVTRAATKSVDGFVYEIEDDIVEYYGEWKAQLKFEKDGEVYVSSPVVFRIENDLGNDRPPQLTEVNNWKNLRSIADGLISDIRNEIEVLEAQELEMRTAEAARQSAESTRIENEKQRNLSSVEEFVKLQEAVGGRNLLKWNPDNELKTLTKTNAYFLEYPELNKQALLSPGETYTIHIDYRITQGTGRFYLGRGNINGIYISETGINLGSGVHTFTYTAPDNLGMGVYLAFRFLRDGIVTNGECTIKDFSVRKGNVGNIPWTKAPESYTVITKDNYYNHVKMMNDFKDNQFNQVKKAVIALGGVL